MTGKNMCLEPSVSHLNRIICSWKLVICAVKNSNVTCSKNWLEILVYLLEHWHGTSQHNYPRSSPKLHLHHFHIDCESKQQVGQMSFEHCLVVQIPKHWSFKDVKKILDHLCSVLATLTVQHVSIYWNRGDKNKHASRKKE